ncbi:MAG TPA: hypothetical protein VD994_07100 [Prosthecobacter sp.]|nr:hypothetical protein [Prosthecobacter sp.]
MQETLTQILSRAASVPVRFQKLLQRHRDWERAFEALRKAEKDAEDRFMLPLVSKAEQLQQNLSQGAARDDLVSLMNALSEWDEELRHSGENPELQALVSKLHGEVLDTLQA